MVPSAAAAPTTGAALLLAFDAALSELAENSKPHINSLTMVAEENIAFASDLVLVLVRRILEAPPPRILPLVYVMDSILKNVGGLYVSLIEPHVVTIFASAFSRSALNIRESLLRLLQTWHQTRLFTPKTLSDIEAQVLTMLTAASSVPLPVPTPPVVTPAVVPQVIPATHPAIVPPSVPIAPTTSAALSASPSLPTGPAPSRGDRINTLLGGASKLGIKLDANAMMETEALLLRQLHSAMKPHTRIRIHDAMPARGVVYLRPELLRECQELIVRGVQLPPIITECLEELDLLEGLRETVSPVPVSTPAPFPPQSSHPASGNVNVLGMGTVSSYPQSYPNVPSLSSPFPSISQSPAPTPTQFAAPTAAPSSNVPSVSWLQSVLNRVTVPPSRESSELDQVTAALKELYPADSTLCEQCGRRFGPSEENALRLHLDEHFQKTQDRLRRAGERGNRSLVLRTRRWYSNMASWVQNPSDTVAPAQSFFEALQSTGTEEAAPAPSFYDDVPEATVGNEDSPLCMACLEPIPTQWDHQKEEWVTIGGLRDNGDLYHRRCLAPTTDEGVAMVGVETEQKEVQGDQQDQETHAPTEQTSEIPESIPDLNQPLTPQSEGHLEPKPSGDEGQEVDSGNVDEPPRKKPRLQE